MSTCCWASWRRDLLFAVLGAVLTAAVLVPLGWSRLRVEQDRAAALEHELEAIKVEREQETARLKAAHMSELLRMRDTLDAMRQAAEAKLRIPD